MEQKNPVYALIARWPSRAALAQDIDTSVDRVHKWAQNGSIPPQFMAAVVKAATARGVEITADEMLEMHAPASQAAE